MMLIYVTGGNRAGGGSNRTKLNESSYIQDRIQDHFATIKAKCKRHHIFHWCFMMPL